MTRGGRPTLETVAAAAGVSLATVSKVLNHREDVGAATRSRVQQLLDQYDYVPPRRSAVSRGADASRVIELVVTDPDSPYFAEIMRGVTSSAMDVVVSSVPTSSEPHAWSS